MFNNLLESEATTTRRTGGGVVSLLLHSAVVVALVIGTANAGQPATEDTPERIEFVPVPKDEPPPAPEQAPPPDVVAVPPVPKGFQTLVPPDIIPLDIPEIDLSRAVTSEADFVGVGTPGGRSDGTSDGAPPLMRGDTPFTELEVEKPAAMAGSPSMAYPEVLRSAQVEGTVLASFVVDTSGYADLSTFTVLRSDHVLFTEAVRRALGRIRYLPAEVGGRKVKQLVQQPFQFRLNR
jgi:periplasmic protein TonB